MRIPNLGEIELLVPLHDGMFEQPMWQTFLSRLQSAANAEGAAIILQSGGDVVRLSAGEVEEANDLSELRPGRPYAPEELGAQQHAIRLTGEGGLVATLVVQRGEGGTSSLLAALAPHFGAALRVLSGLERERARSAMSAQAFARLDFGWISLDAKGRIVDSDQQAERLLRESGLLARGAYDRLVPSDPAVDRQLTGLVKAFAANPRARPRAINLSHDPWIDILVSPLRLAALAGGKDAVAVVYLRGDRSSSETRAEQLVDLFNLTPSEARMAWSMAQGLSIAEAAEEHGLTIETARNYSKKIYAKTGARGQVDLVRHVLTGVLALA
ncbi:helix-turn-helix transcriptional regulator [Aurantiacibacter sp. MUD61]|uniref:helix-turn-helix transcriptional regulator n=1 Tax=Aurantiacibacter sp. MUD61 TaxID=3009083 RepID=UPI0022F088DE|nr:helix-turn-helix transcriptional regulator [Aurantiacibacter sp. MUD61]